MHNTRKWGLLAAPKAQTVTFDTEDIKAGADGNPTSGAVRLDQLLPPEFTSGFASFGTCDTARIATATTKPDCPADSLVGTLQATLYLTEFKAKVTSDQGDILSTACTGGRWTLQTHLESLDGTDETTQNAVDCTSGRAEASPDPAPGLGRLLPPLPSPAA